jgi:hypothetical protein
MEVSGQFHALAALPLGDITLGVHYIGGWVGPRVGLDVVEKRKNVAMPGIEPGPFSP